MSVWELVVLSVLLATASCQNANDFPSGFQFGAGTSAYQIEGGWNASDKGENIWDRWTHAHPDRVLDGSTGDVACDSYHQWQTDVNIAADLGLAFYRFSISWARVLPTGFSNYISEDGKNYYNNLINGLLEKGVEPMITMYHWELPQRLQDLGGWANPLIVDWFGDYSRVLYSLYGDRVKNWLTINEAMSVCDIGYSDQNFAPGIEDFTVGRYLCSKNIVLAHARAYRIYDEEFRAKYNGRVSLANHFMWFEPETPDDEEVAELAIQLAWGRYSHPIFSKEGGYPQDIEEIFAKHSAAEGYTSSRLPAFTKEEIEYTRGTFDYIGMNHYTSRMARRAKPGEPIGYFPLEGSEELNLIIEMHPDSKPTGYPLLPSYPVGLRKTLVWMKKHYGDHEIVITENGYGSNVHDRYEEESLSYYKDYLEQVLLAIKEDGVNVTGYSAWSLMDNFEWASGYLIKFGLYSVDFDDPSRTRTPRAAALYYADVIKARSLDVPDNFV